MVGEYIAVVFPGIVSLGVSLPLDEVLEDSPLPKTAMISDGLDFVLLFSVDDVRGGVSGSWLRIVLFHDTVIEGRRGTHCVSSMMGEGLVDTPLGK